MKVWIVLEPSDCDGSRVIGVFSSEEKAIEFARIIDQDLYLEEHEIDEAKPVPEFTITIDPRETVIKENIKYYSPEYGWVKERQSYRLNGDVLEFTGVSAESKERALELAKMAKAQFYIKLKPRVE